VQAVHQAVVGVGQFTVAVETRRAGAAEQHGETRVFADLEASAQGIGAQAVHCQRHQRLTVQAQQRGGVARQQGAHGLQQAAVTLAFGQFAGQVGDQGEQGGEQRLRSHNDSL